MLCRTAGGFPEDAEEPIFHPWVNPLKASPGYAPLARGMAAALPYVDAFVEGHSLAALQELAAEINV